jgi:glutaredoxin-related protein
MCSYTDYYNCIIVDVLSDEAIRQGVKEFSDWPTIPQVSLCQLWQRLKERVV